MLGSEFELASNIFPPHQSLEHAPGKELITIGHGCAYYVSSLGSMVPYGLGVLQARLNSRGDTGTRSGTLSLVSGACHESQSGRFR